MGLNFSIEKKEPSYNRERSKKAEIQISVLSRHF